MRVWHRPAAPSPLCSPLPSPWPSDAGHRLYDADAVARLADICLYRNAGLSLETIAELVAQSDGHTEAGLKESWVKILTAAGMDEIARLRPHPTRLGCR